MLFLIIERFQEEKIKALYERYDELGRLLPAGVKYINSWITTDLSSCYQIMDSPDETLITEWIKNWDDLAQFEVLPLINSEQARNQILNTKHGNSN